MEDENITLSCTYEGSVDSLHWYQQKPGSRSEFLIMIDEASEYVTKANPPYPRLSIKLHKAQKRVHLKISSVAVTDSAVYYCALRPTVTGNAHTLYKNPSTVYNSEGLCIWNVNIFQCEKYTGVYFVMLSSIFSVTVSARYVQRGSSAWKRHFFYESMRTTSTSTWQQLHWVHQKSHHLGERQMWCSWFVWGILLSFRPRIRSTQTTRWAPPAGCTNTNKSSWNQNRWKWNIWVWFMHVSL